MQIVTFPTQETLAEYQNRTPKHMYPNDIPYAVIFEGIITNKQCDWMLENFERIETYKFDRCNAVTREMGQPLHSSLEPLVNLLEFTNRTYFNYNVDMGSATAWLQRYVEGDNYSLHTDGAPGQTRKLTAVLMLTDGSEYFGGDLTIRSQEVEMVVPKSKGTVAIFQSWVLHDVSKITKGVRHTINLGVWGPSFR